VITTLAVEMFTLHFSMLMITKLVVCFSVPEIKTVIEFLSMIRCIWTMSLRWPVI